MKKFLGKSFDRGLQFLQPKRMELAAIYSKIFADASGSLIDIGCGVGGHLRDVEFNRDLLRVGIDSHQASLDVALQNGVYTSVINADAKLFLASCEDNSYDFVLASCVIEHLEKSEGLAFLTEIERVAARKVILFTPNGFVPQPPDIDNPANEHKSGWKVEEFRSRGYQVNYGLYGLRFLRTSFGLPTIRPTMLGDLLSKATSRAVFRLPNLAYQIVAVLDLKSLEIS